MDLAKTAAAAFLSFFVIRHQDKKEKEREMGQEREREREREESSETQKQSGWQKLIWPRHRIAQRGCQCNIDRGRKPVHMRRRQQPKTKIEQRKRLVRPLYDWDAVTHTAPAKPLYATDQRSRRGMASTNVACVTCSSTSAVPAITPEDPTGESCSELEYTCHEAWNTHILAAEPRNAQ